MRPERSSRLPRVRLAPLLACGSLVLTLAACGATPSSAEKFSGDEKAVAQVVEDIEAAGRSRDAAEICSRLLATELADRIKEGGKSCTEELGASLDDADDFDLQVEDVTVTGTTATARVKGRDGTKDRVATFRFVKEGTAWKAQALSDR
jgi:hypothetical protein